MAAGALVLLLGLSGCSRAPEVSVPPRAADAACVAAAKAWPAAVAGQGVIATSTDSPAVRAWGSPAVIARCGLEPLAPTTDPCVVVDGVDWVVRTLSDGASATTYGRDPAIEVLIPKAYAPEPLLLPAFGAAAAALPSTGHHCS